MYYVSSLSGGVASAVATDLAIQRYGRDRVVLWFADTSWEDHDLYRFLNDCLDRWGGGMVVHTDGRTPLAVAEDKRIIPNQKLAPCTFVLKIDPFTAWLEAQPRPVTVLLGLDWTERHRMAVPKERYEAFAGVTVDFPLEWGSRAMGSRFAEVRNWGIEIPRLYRMGFAHNNCGGRCFRQGHRGWRLLYRVMPERYFEVAEWEQRQRVLAAQAGRAAADYAILRDRRGGQLRPLTLLDLLKRSESVDLAGQPVQEDLFGCLCSY